MDRDDALLLRPEEALVERVVLHISTGVVETATQIEAYLDSSSLTTSSREGGLMSCVRALAARRGMLLSTASAT